MDRSRHVELMHAVLDGEATFVQAKDLERLMAADPAVREEYAALERVFAALRQVAQPHLPEGLYASVMNNLPAAERTRQLFTASRVIVPHDEPSQDSGTSTRSRRPEEPPAQQKERLMSEQQSFGKRKAVWIGASLAVAAVIVVSLGIYPPSDGNTSGAIVPAQRFRAEQPTSGGVNGGAPADTAQRAQGSAPSGTGDAMKDGRAEDAKLIDGRIGDAKLTDGRIGDAKLTDGRIGDAKLIDGRIGDAKLTDGRIGDAKVTDGRVGDAKLTDGRIGDAKVTDGRVGDAKLTDGRIGDAKVTDGRVGDAKVTDGRIGDAKVTDGRVGDAKLTDGRVGDAKKSDARYQ